MVKNKFTKKITYITTFTIVFVFIIISSVIAQGFCPKCNKLLPISDEIKYCPHCGLSLEVKNPRLRNDGIGYFTGYDYSKKRDQSLVFSPFYNYISNSGFGCQINLIGMHITDSSSKIPIQENGIIYNEKREVSYSFPVIFKYYFFIEPFYFSPYAGVGLSYYRINELNKEGLTPLLNAGITLFSNGFLQLIIEWRYFINVYNNKFHAGFILYGGSINW